MRSVFPFICIILTAGCGKEIYQLNLTGTIKGSVYTLSEKRIYTNDQENVTITLEDSDPLLSVTAGTSGSFSLQDIPSGTYNLVISKDGYGTIVHQGLAIVGGDKPIYQSFSLFEKSKTTLTELSLEAPLTTSLNFSGTIIHNFLPADFYKPNIRFYIGTTEDVSPENYLYSSTREINVATGQTFALSINISFLGLGSGTNVYFKAYGVVPNETGYLNIITNSQIYTSLGSASATQHVVLP
jgi:hypothetical protein